MSEGESSAGCGPGPFTLTAEEAETAASRAGLRAALSSRLSIRHVAPLVIFVMLIAFVAILTATGLLGRRIGEATLLAAAIAFMATRLASHFRLRGARKASLAAANEMKKAGTAQVRLDASGLRVETAAGSRHLAFADCDEVEDAAGIIYLWSRKGEPAFIPARAFASEGAAREFLASVRASIARAAIRRA